MNSGSVHIPFFGDVTWTGRQPVLDRKEHLFVGYSVRNRNFTKPFFKAAGSLALAEFRTFLIAIFDVPYAYNDSAARDGSPPDQADFDKSVRIGDERELMVRRAIDKMANVSIKRWHQLQTPQVLRLRDELRAASVKSDAFREALLHNAMHWLQRSGHVEPEDFLEFQLQEFPVLLDIYYREGHLIDLYPGRHVQFFFDLEQGRWSGELPLATQLSKGKHLCFLNTEADASL